jgi:hypothetical protein
MTENTAANSIGRESGAASFARSGILKIGLTNASVPKPYLPSGRGPAGRQDSRVRCRQPGWPHELLARGVPELRRAGALPARSGNISNNL